MNRLGKRLAALEAARPRSFHTIVIDADKPREPQIEAEKARLDVQPGDFVQIIAFE